MPEPWPEHVPSSTAALTPAPTPERTEEPSVVAQQRAIAESFDAIEAEEEPALEESVPVKAEVVKLPKAKAAALPGRKAAFTLRLDADRHLRLRLACAVTGRSAQLFVTAALDQALAEIPEIEALASRVPAASGKRK